MTDWQPIQTAPRDRTILLHTSYPKARYKMVFGRWNDRLNEWQSQPGAWPMKPTNWAECPEPPKD